MALRTRDGLDGLDECDKRRRVHDVCVALNVLVVLVGASIATILFMWAWDVGTSCGALHWLGLLCIVCLCVLRSTY